MGKLLCKSIDPDERLIQFARVQTWQKIKMRTRCNGSQGDNILRDLVFDHLVYDATTIDPGKNK